MSDVNIPLLRKAVEWVEEQAALPVEASEWQQGYWRTTTHACGTAYCVAGYIAESEGYDWEGNGVTFAHLDVPDIASRALGIEPALWWDAEPGDQHLFDEWNTAADVRRIAEALAGERL